MGTAVIAGNPIPNRNSLAIGAMSGGRDAQLSGSSAINVPVGFVEPPGGSTVNASFVEPPMFSSTAVVDGDTASASMVPAEVAPPGLTSHIW